MLFLLKINLVCPVKELSSAERGNTGSYSTELLEVSKSQQETGCNRNMMLRGRDTLRAAGQETEGRARGEARNREKSKGRGTEDKIGNGATRVSFSVTLFHMVEPLFKRPITL